MAVLTLYFPLCLSLSDFLEGHSIGTNRSSAHSASSDLLGSEDLYDSVPKARPLSSGSRVSEVQDSDTSRCSSLHGAVGGNRDSHCSCRDR